MTVDLQVSLRWLQHDTMSSRLSFEALHLHFQISFLSYETFVRFNQCAVLTPKISHPYFAIGNDVLEIIDLVNVTFSLLLELKLLRVAW
mmetsp:Transcript_20904/g.45274  ORF Transcript_20904/g.45274 Transcript_20904/m.45274 type:complete len:89 (+) Transcript_20904:467-733(+)